MMRKLNLSLLTLVLLTASCSEAEVAKSSYWDMDVLPFIDSHVHGATIVELPNGDFLSAWFQGSGERWSDDVAIMGARLDKTTKTWSESFLMADVPDFPDINPVLFIDAEERLWLVWYTVIANQWSTSLLKYRISEDYLEAGAPTWDWQDVIHVKPGDESGNGIQLNDKFVKSVERQIEEIANTLTDTSHISLWYKWGDRMLSKARGEDFMTRGTLIDSVNGNKNQKMGYPYFRRMGWQTKNKAVIVDHKRIILPLYSDGFDFSIMAITDNGGKNWIFSEPLVGAGNIQPSIVFKSDGTMLAYMRDNGPPPEKMQVAHSADKGLSWSIVKDSDLPNPGSGADFVTLENGHWLAAYNDGLHGNGRQSLAISISINEGESWDFTRHVERETKGENEATSFAYPSVIQAKDRSIHLVYSYQKPHENGISQEKIKYAEFYEAWVMEGDH